jgi:molybdate transport system substrate-binding protein
MCNQRIRKKCSSGGSTQLLIVAAASLIVLAILIGVLVWNSDSNRPEVASDELLVYCAVSVQPALRAVAAEYQRETRTAISIQTGSSGALEAQIRLSGKGDLYIPAAQSPYLDRLHQDGAVREVLPLAIYQLVLALNPRVEDTQIALSDLIEGKLQFAVANEEAAAGLATREALEPLGIWPQIEQSLKAVLPTVTGVAQAVKRGVALDCGFVWDTTARQYGLPMIELPELADARATVAVGVLSFSDNPAAARQFAEHLAGDSGQAVFRKLGYTIPSSHAERK